MTSERPPRPPRPDIRVVVLDDDPTGIQTVHGCWLMTDWEPERLRLALEDAQPFFYVLTNTRAYSRERARRTIGEAVTGVLKANHTQGHRLVFVSRSDSTLRNHFPAEVETIIRKLESAGGTPVDAVFLVPAFIECGRVTAGDTHYLLEHDRRIPVSETEFARDSVFGYHTALLPDYIEEKTQGAVRAASVLSVPLEWLRKEKSTELWEFLGHLRGRSYVVVNAETYDHLRRFAQAVLGQVACGKRFVFQSAGSLVKALAGLSDQPFLDGRIVRGPGRGLFVAGSHVGRTTTQLKRLLEAPGVEGLEMSVAEVLQSPRVLRRKTLGQIEGIWRRGRTPVVFTSRAELQFRSKAERLGAGIRISHFLAGVVHSLPFTPAYLVSKGGITSHDILVRGLEVRQARVLGQLMPGVPVIRTSQDSPFPGIPFVIFPGNVGDENSLARVFGILTKR